MPQSDLQEFVDAAKQKGAGDEFLAHFLASRGWPAAEVYNALGVWWERTAGVALPARRSTAENARDAFLYLLAFSTLATWASALGSLWFRLIDHWLPDPVVTPVFFNFRDMLTWHMAAILVALPIYLSVMRVVLRETRANPDRLQSGVCKWLTYIALLLAAAGVVSDLVCFVGYFLKGELTLRFVLKCVTVLAICGSIFWYYLQFLRGKLQSGAFAVAAVATAGLALICGLVLTGPPSTQRRIEADSRRVQDLRQIAGTLNSLPELPASLDQLRTSRPGLTVTDPETRAPYEYRLKGGKQFELCATFAAPDEKTAPNNGTGFWSHPQGHTCFAFEAGRPTPW